MQIKIHQINFDRDKDAVAFESFDRLPKGFDISIYDEVWSGAVAANDLEDVYRIFNVDKPEDFTGHSLSVSDLVEVIESDEVKNGIYFCDSIGFRKVG